MTCYFRVSGTRFDVDRFGRRSTLPAPSRVFRRGEIAFPRSKIKHLSTPSARSGFNIRIGSDDSWELKGQLRAALAFLRKHRRELKRLARFPGVQSIRFDFGLNMDEKAMGQYFAFPTDLITQCAAAKIGLEVSIYRWDEWERSQRKAAKSRKKQPGR